MKDMVEMRFDENRKVLVEENKYKLIIGKDCKRLELICRNTSHTCEVSIKGSLDELVVSSVLVYVKGPLSVKNIVLKSARLVLVDENLSGCKDISLMSSYLDFITKKTEISLNVKEINSISSIIRVVNSDIKVRNLDLKNGSRLVLDVNSPKKKMDIGANVSKDMSSHIVYPEEKRYRINIHDII